MKKFMTREQAQTSKDRAARFVLNVLQDPDGAQAIEDESLDDWVERKKITLTNPHRGPRLKVLTNYNLEEIMANETMAELLEKIKDLKEENEDLRAENDDLADQLDAIGDIIADEGDTADDLADQLAAIDDIVAGDEEGDDNEDGAQD